MVRNAGNIGCARVILRVTTVAVGGQGAGVIIGVAGSAGDGCMRSGKWKCRFAVIEGRRNPRGRVVTDLTLLRHAGLYVVWRGCCVVILHMAAVAIGRRVRELTIDMAQIAGDCGMGAG